LRMICSAVCLVRFRVESPAQSGRMRTLIHPGPISGVHVITNWQPIFFMGSSKLHSPIFCLRALYCTLLCVRLTARDPWALTKFHLWTPSDYACLQTYLFSEYPFPLYNILVTPTFALHFLSLCSCSIQCHGLIWSFSL